MLISLILLQSVAPLDVYGVWETANGKAHVEIVRTDDGSPRGEIIWYRNYDEEKVFDVENPDPEARDDEILGLTLLEDFEKGDDGEKWRRGTIYDPTSGSSYRSAIYRQSDKILAVEGCLGFICRTQEWTRVPEGEIRRVGPTAGQRAADAG